MAGVRCSIVTCCSNAAEMFWLSSYSALVNEPAAFDYVVVLWGESPHVRRMATDLEELGNGSVHLVDYQPDPSVAFVPNLRGMMNAGFARGFELNEYAGLTNTDVFHGPLWLSNMAKHARPDRVVNCQHLSPIKGPNIVTADFGVPERGKFDVAAFYRSWKLIAHDALETEADRRGEWRAVNTMPYLFHRDIWNACGPWELEVGEHRDPPDRRFFQRVKDAGCEYVMAMDSVVYHHEAVERRTGSRPRGAESMPNGL